MPYPGHFSVEINNQPPLLVKKCRMAAFEMPAYPNASMVLNEILKALGDPFYYKGTYADLRDRAISFLKLCGTRVIVIDEASRLVDDSGELTSNRIVELIKQLNSQRDLSISIVFFGLGRLRILFEADDQILDRFGNAVRLDAFRCFHRSKEGVVRNDDEFRKWKATLRGIQNATGLVSEKPISDSEWAKRLYYATAGVLRRLKILLRQALRYAQQNHPEQGIILDDLAQSYGRVARGNVRGFNPFDPIFPSDAPPPQLDDDKKTKLRGRLGGKKAAKKPNPSYSLSACIPERAPACGFST